MGALGYIVKSEAGRQLLPTIDAVIQDRPFLIAGLPGRDFSGVVNGYSDAIRHHHEVAFYADDTALINGYSRFVVSSLQREYTVITVNNESHRAKLLPKLEKAGVDVAKAIEQDCYFPYDTTEVLSRVSTANNMPDPVRWGKVMDDLFTRPSQAAKRRSNRIAICGEIAPTLLSQGNGEGAIRAEQLWNQITSSYRLHTLCGYPLSAFPGGKKQPDISKSLRRTFSRSCGGIGKLGCSRRVCLHGHLLHPVTLADENRNRPPQLRLSAATRRKSYLEFRLRLIGSTRRWVARMGSFSGMIGSAIIPSKCFEIIARYQRRRPTRQTIIAACSSLRLVSAFQMFISAPCISKAR